MEAFLHQILPDVIGEGITFRIINHGNKQSLLRDLPDRLKGYRRRLPHEDLKITVLLDEDRQGCSDVKEKLETAARLAGLSTKTEPDAVGTFHVLTRIAIEELEAWYFGDVAAMRAAYPRLPENLGRKSSYRKPDAIKGGTWERLHQEMKKAGYYQHFFPKIEIARNIAPHIEIERNTSTSFQRFFDGFRRLTASP